MLAMISGPMKKVAIGCALAVATVPVVFPMAARAETGAEVPVGDAAVRALAETLRIGDVIGVMRDEGLDYGTTLREQMFPEASDAPWQAEVQRIYDPARMRQLFDTVLARELAGDTPTITAATSFFGDARGQKILRLELEARRALLDDDLEAAARQAAQRMEEEGAPRFDALRRFASTNDLIEMNVMGALNANLAFYKGLSAGGGFGQAMSEEDMLAEVWGQEEDVRGETEDWLWPYLSLAYGPLSDEELQAYIAFSATPAGQKLNAAVFAAFDAVFVRISGELGLAAARQMQGQDI